MPPKRRSSGPASKSQQSTLAFHGSTNKVTKAGARTQSAKDLVEGTKAKPIEPETKIIEPETKDIKPEESEIEDTKQVSTEAVAVAEPEPEIEAPSVQSSPEEEQARRITDAAIKKYWAAKEKQRVAPRVHQKDLSLNEKILREFDMSGHYGPCTGIARMKRWKRAHKLDLDPPIEVLAVLLREEEEKDSATVQKSRVDELLNSKADLEA